MPTTLIIGAGVTGLSTAYHLALKKHGRIIVLDKGPIGDGSSLRAAAIVTGLLWSETGVLGRRVALRRFREMSNELPGYAFQALGCLNWFDPPSWPDRLKLLPLYDRCGAPYEVLTPAEMQKRWPALRVPDNFMGLYDPLGGYSEPDEYIPALANQCRRMGVEILESQRATALLSGASGAPAQITGVRTAEGEIRADAVVCTSFAWANHLLATVGLSLPVKAFVHQRYITRPLPKAVSISPVNANPLGGYVRPALGNRLLLGIETPDRLEHLVPGPEFHMSSLTADPQLPATLMERFSLVVAGLSGAAWESRKVGLITYALDGEPILGPVAALPGLFVGLAFHSGGFAWNPASGYLLAEMVAAPAPGSKTSVDVSAFSPQRFDADEARQYLASTVPQSQAARRRH